MRASDDDAASPWPLARVLRTKRAADCLGIDARGVQFHAGPWRDLTQTALVVPIHAAQDDLAGFLVVGVSPRRPLDAAYRTFFDLVAGHIATTISGAQAYEAQRERAETLAQIDRAKTAFFSNVSHEFRTPLTLMLGPIEEEMLSCATGPLTIERANLDLVHRNTLRLLKLVNTLLDFSRIEAGRVQANYEAVDLPAYTAELASVFRAAIEKAGLRLSIDCPSLNGPVYVDRSIWEKIVLNLISNAFKFTFEGEIEVSLRRDDKFATLAVRDTGIGIEEDQLPRLFERFHRIEGARGRTYEGSGIGLALVQDLVKLHGGTVAVESIYGQGSIFRVAIPLGQAHLPAKQVGPKQVSTAVGANAFVEEALRWLPEAANETMPRRSDTETSRLSSNRILFADDNADLRQYVQRLLSQTYEVQLAADGEAALRMARENPPDLVLADVMMPRLDGFGLLQALRIDPCTRNVPVILLSARAGEESRVEGLQAGADDYLIKPFSARELLARVSARLEIGRLHREALEREQKLRIAAEAAEAEVARKNEQLQEAQARTESVLASVTDIHILFDRRWRYLYVNEAAARAIGLPAEHIVGLGRTLWELFPDIVGTELDRQYRRAMDERVPMAFDFYYARRDTWWSSRFYPTPEGLAVFATEITERKRAEEALRRAHDELEQRVAERTEALSALNAELIKEIAERKRAEAELLALKDELAADLRAMTGLLELNMRLLATAELQQLLEEVLNATVEMQHSDFGMIQLYDPDSRALKLVAHRGFEQTLIDQFNEVDEASDSIYGHALRRGERVIVEDIQADPTFASLRPFAAPAGVRAVQSTPLFGHNGRIVGMISTHFRQPHRPSERELRFVDLYARQAAEMIERKRVENNLRRSEAYLAEGQRLNHTGSWAWNASTGELFWSEELFRIHGFDPEKVKPGYPMILQHIHGDDRSQVQQIFESAVQERISYELAFRIVRPDGTIRHISNLAHPVFDASGDLIEYVGTTIDITERKHSEELVRKAHEQVEMILDSISDNFFGVSSDGRFTYFNKHAVKQMQILGKDPAHLIGKVAWEEFPDMPNKKNVQRVLTERVPITDELYYPPLGEWVENHMYPSPDGGLVTFQRYITARKRTEEELRKAQAELAHVSRVTLMGELAASIAHEINQPLGAIVNNGNVAMHLATADNGSLDKLVEVLSDIVSDADRAGAIIAHIRALAKKSIPEKSSLQLKEVVSEVLALANRELNERRITVQTELPKDLPRVSGDRVQLQQVLLNLVMNGMEAMSAVEDERRILTIGGQRDELDGTPAVLITVRDLGVGFKPGDSERLFDAFYTTKPDGLGMGLRISRSIIEAHGGRLWATTGKGPGATFYCALPAE